MEIYNEKVRDLLDDNQNSEHLKVREHPKYGPYVQSKDYSFSNLIYAIILQILFACMQILVATLCKTPQKLWNFYQPAWRDEHQPQHTQTVTHPAVTQSLASTA